jgi:cysteine-rich repeat protein
MTTIRWERLGQWWVAGMGVLAACGFDSSGQATTGGVSVSSATEETSATDTNTATDATTATDPTTVTDATTTTTADATTATDPTTDTNTATDTTTLSTGTDDSSGDSAAVCGDGTPELDEECDDADDDETDGCLSTCVVARSCAQVLAERPGGGIDDGIYRIELPEGPLDVYCDMTTDGGGWMLVAKVNPTDQDTNPRSEPVGWFGMTLGTEDLASPDLELNGQLASLGASVVLPLVDEGTLARFELIAADNYGVRASWYKQALAESFVTWFDFGDTPTMVCSDLAMTENCVEETIAPSGGANSPTLLRGMDLVHFGYPGGYPIHMRLSDDTASPWFSGICSSTADADSNMWPDSYAAQWGNALRIWLR